MNGPNMATVYSDRGHGVRAPVVFYNRCNEAAALLKPGDFDWKAIFGGRRALVPQRRDLRLALGDDGRAHRRRDAGGEGRRRRHELRPELPRETLEHLGRARQKAVEVIGRIVEHVDVLVGNEGGPPEGARDSGAGGRREVETRSRAFFGMIDKVVAKHPRVKVVAPRCAKSTPPTGTAGARWRG